MRYPLIFCSKSYETAKLGVQRITLKSSQAGQPPLPGDFGGTPTGIQGDIDAKFWRPFHSKIT